MSNLDMLNTDNHTQTERTDRKFKIAFWHTEINFALALSLFLKPPNTRWQEQDSEDGSRSALAARSC